MSLITRCPACHTSFKVVRDQLRISEGWVRCGQCQQIFDANATLFDEDQPLAPPHQKPELASHLGAYAVQRSAVSVPGLPPTAVEPFADLSLSFGAIDPPIDLSIDLPADPAIGLSANSPVDPHLALPSAAMAVETPPHAQQVPLDAKSSEGADSSPSVEAPHEALVKAAVQDVSFMRNMPQKSSWQRTSIRVLLGGAVLVLTCVLGLQVALHERDGLAARFPQTKPALNWLCGQLSCSVSNFRHIESVVIDSSSFNKIRPDVYRLALAVRNTSAMDIAMPALELTLTDSQDQALVRRVLLVNEFSNSNTLAAASEWTGAIAINVRASGAAERFSGYRVLAFYP